MSRVPTTAEIAALSCELHTWIHDSANRAALADVLNCAVEQYNRERDARVHLFGGIDPAVSPAVGEEGDSSATSAVVNAASLFVTGVKKGVSVTLDAMTSDVVEQVVEQLAAKKLDKFSVDNALSFFTDSLDSLQEEWKVSNTVTLTRAAFKTIVIAKIQHAYFSATTKKLNQCNFKKVPEIETAQASAHETAEELDEKRNEEFDFVEQFEATPEFSKAVSDYQHIKILSTEGCAEKIYRAICAVDLNNTVLLQVFNWIQRAEKIQIKELIEGVCNEYDQTRKAHVNALGVPSGNSAVVDVVRSSYMTLSDALLTNSANKVRSLFSSDKGYDSLFWGLGEFDGSDWKHQGHALFGYAGRASLKTLIVAKLVASVSLSESEKILKAEGYAEIFYTQLHALRHYQTIFRDKVVEAMQTSVDRVSHASF